MKNVISVILLSLSVTCSALVGLGQKGPDATKTKSATSEQRKTPNSGAPTALNGGNEAGAKTEGATVTTTEVTPEASAMLTEVYRVGIGDILDVRFMNSRNAGRSTLFTVVDRGIIDFPLAGGQIIVAGLTTDEIQARIGTELKRRAVTDSAEISVGVRQYASHSVLITGLVSSPGMRILRREAVPLYVVLAESQLRNDAGRVIIMRNGSTGQSLDLSDPLTLNTVVVNGDVVTVSARPQEFYYIAGRINYPGQKTFQSGITLLQAILAAGGTSRQNESVVEISREGTDGRLVTSRFKVKQIKSGAIEDPKLQAGDRIEVVH
jgi:protein involved in polysaccharide export with SLBB domain